MTTSHMQEHTYTEDEEGGENICVCTTGLVPERAGYENLSVRLSPALEDKKRGREHDIAQPELPECAEHENLSGRALIRKMGGIDCVFS